MLLKYILGCIAVLTMISPKMLATVKYVPNEYATISAAVAASSAGDTVRVFAGTYIEYLDIGKSLTLIGSWPDTSTTIQAPNDFPGNVAYQYQTQPSLFNARASLVRVAPGTNTTIQGFIVDGTNPPAANIAFTGILVDSASATIKGNEVMNFLPSDTSGTPSTLQSGRGIEVLGGDGESLIDSNTISTCQRYHILVSATDDMNTSPAISPKAIVSRNTVTGVGLSKLGQKGIWFNWGAYGSATNNIISGLDYNQINTSDRASGIVVKHGEYRAGGASRVLISGNTVTAITNNSNKGIFTEGKGDSIVGNSVSGFHFNIQVDDDDSAYVLKNTVTGGRVGVLVTRTTEPPPFTDPVYVVIGGSVVNKNTITGQPKTSQGGAAISLSFRNDIEMDGDFTSTVPVIATYNDFGVYAAAQIDSLIYDRMDATQVPPIDTVLYQPFWTDKIRASVKVFLQGPYVASGDTMARTLNSSGTLAAHFGAIPIPALAVDSINIELRNAASATGSTTRKFTPAWLLTDGTIRGFSDTTKSYIEFDTTLSGGYYLVVRHRNHLGIMCAGMQSLDGTSSPAVYDLSTAQTKAFGTNPMKHTGSRFSLYCGNVDGNTGIGASDVANEQVAVGILGYNINDVDLNGGVGASDIAVTSTNVGQLNQVP